MVARTKEERDANLDALKTAVEQYADNELARLENENKFIRTVLQARGADGVSVLNLDEASALLQAELDDFLGVG